ncbi:MAG: SRPBCC family protein [Pseudomonadota bacterium]
MKFSSNEDIEAPIETVFRMYSDFEWFERAALRRGADITRTDNLRGQGAGMTWQASFKFRGKARTVVGEVVDFSSPDSLAIDADSPNLKGMLSVEMVPLSRNRTRVAIALELKPKSLTGRLMVQSLKLGKTRLTRQFKLKAAQFAKTQETRFKSGEFA